MKARHRNEDTLEMEPIQRNAIGSFMSCPQEEYLDDIDRSLQTDTQMKNQVNANNRQFTRLTMSEIDQMEKRKKIGKKLVHGAHMIKINNDRYFTELEEKTLIEE